MKGGDVAMPKRPRWGAGRLCAMAILVAAIGAAETPSVAPEIVSIFPRGIQRGTSAEIRFLGKNLARASKIEFTGPGVSAKILRATQTELLARVTADPDAPPGRRDARLFTATGTDVEGFDVGTLRETVEQEPNDDLDHAQTIQPPVLVNGVIGPKGADYDCFRFHANAGQTFIFDVNATRNGSSLDSELSLFDSQGKKLAYNDDYYIHKDSFLSYTLPVSGDFILRIRGRGDSASRAFDYRLTIGELPHLTDAFPAGGKRGESCEIAIPGVNLDKVREVWLAEGRVRGEVLAGSKDQLRTRLSLPSDLAPGLYALRAITSDGYASGPLAFEVSGFAELTVIPGKARSRAQAMAIHVPVVVNGIIDQEKASDYFSLQAEAGEQFRFKVDSMRLGYLLDPTVTIYDEQGHDLAFQDDPAPNQYTQVPNVDPDLTYKFEKPGRFVVGVRDATGTPRPNCPYRLTITRANSDFEVHFMTSDLTVVRGETAILPIRVKRRGGWGSPVVVSPENLPKGVSFPQVQAEAKDSTHGACNGHEYKVDGTDIDLPVKVSADSAPGTFILELRGQGAFEGHRLERAGVADYLYKGLAIGRKLTGPTEDGKMYVTVVDPPHFVLNGPGKVTLKPVAPTKVKIKVARLSGAKDAIELKPVVVPPGITVSSSVIGPGEDSVEIEIKQNSALPAEPSKVMLAGIEKASTEGQTEYLDLSVGPASSAEKEKEDDSAE